MMILRVVFLLLFVSLGVAQGDWGWLSLLALAAVAWSLQLRVMAIAGVLLSGVFAATVFASAHWWLVFIPHLGIALAVVTSMAMLGRVLFIGFDRTRGDQ